MVDTFAALAEPSRLRIVELLRGGPRAVNDLVERLELNQPQVSKHLRVLKEAGLVDVEPLAQQRLYELRAQPLRELHDWLERYRQVWDARFNELDALIGDLIEQPAAGAAARRAPRRAPAAREAAAPVAEGNRRHRTQEKPHGRKGRR